MREKSLAILCGLPDFLSTLCAKTVSPKPMFSCVNAPFDAARQTVRPKTDVFLRQRAFAAALNLGFVLFMWRDKFFEKLGQHT